MTQREGVEIDYCPKCRGVWLDRGELDKIVERIAGPPDLDEGGYGRERDPRDYEERDRDRYKHRRKESIWSRFFDFD